MTIASAILATSPAVYWKLDETSGTTAADSSGNGHAGVVSGDVTLGLVGPEVGTHALRAFVTGLVQSAALGLSAWSDFTLGAWVSASIPTPNNTPYPYLGINPVATPASRGPSLRLRSNVGTDVSVDAAFPPGAAVASSSFAVPINFWHWHAITYTASTRTVAQYKDSSLITSQVVSAPTIPQTTDALNIQSGTPLVISNVAYWQRVLTGTELNTISGNLAQWPYALPINTQLTDVTLAPGQIDLTPVTTDLATILTNWAGLQTVTLPSLQDAINAIAAQVTAVQTGVSAIQFPNLAGLVTIPSLDSLTMTELTSGPTTDEFSHDIAGTIWGIVVRCTTVPDWYGVSGPGAVWHQPSLARISIVRGVDELYSELIHNDHYLLTPVPGAVTGTLASLVLPPIEQPGTSVFVVFNQGVAGHVYYLNLP